MTALLQVRLFFSTFIVVELVIFLSSGIYKCYFDRYNLRPF